jgi:hypothetical protein
MHRSQSSAHSWAGGVSAFVLPIAAGAVLGIALACLLVPIHWDDQSFYFYASSRLLDGYHLYSADLQDTNPPLIAWLTMLPMAFARSVGTTPETSFVLFVAILICAAVIWSLRLGIETKQPVSGTYTPWLATVLVYVTVLLPSITWKAGELTDAFGMSLRYDFGQREHLLVLLVLPYLFATVRRLNGVAIPSFEAVLIGCVAALGFSLKPQYLTVAVAVEALVIYRSRNVRCLIRPELIALTLTGIVYCVSVWIITPDYLTKVIPTVATAYGDFGHKTVWQTMMTSKYNFAVVAAAMVASVLQRGSGMTNLTSTFLVAGVAAFVSFLIQGKGWTDHLLPAEAFILFALAMSAAGHLLRWKGEHANAKIGWPAFGVAAAFGCIAGLGLYYPARAGLSAKSEYAKQIAAINQATAGFPPGTPFVALTEGIYSQFNVALDRGFVWASRYPFLLLPPSIIQSAEATDSHHTGNSPGGYFMVSDVLKAFGRSRIDARQYADMLRTDVVEDFRRWRPAIVLVQRCEDPITEPCTFGAGFKIVDWLSADSAFASIWSKYKFARRVERFDLYVTAEPTAAGEGAH